MAARYLGPADHFGYKGQFYKPGESIPMTKEEVEHHVRWGHHFEGIDLADLPPAEPIVVATHPMDDRGAPIIDPARHAVSGAAGGAGSGRAASVKE